MTWKELAKRISQLSEDQQNTHVTVVDPLILEAYPVASCIETIGSEDVGLDEDHPFLVIKSKG